MGSAKETEMPIFGDPVTDDPDDAPGLLEGFFRTAEWSNGDTILRHGQPPIGDQTKP